MAIQVLGWAWIAGLQAFVAYLILIRAQEETSLNRRKAENVSLREHKELLRSATP